MPTTFDEIDLISDDISVTVTRPIGPLEAGVVDPATGAWVPALDAPTNVGGVGFGIDGSGQPYFQVGGADEGEVADLLVNANDGSIWMEA